MNSQQLVNNQPLVNEINIYADTILKIIIYKIIIIPEALDF